MRMERLFIALATAALAGTAVAETSSWSTRTEQKPPPAAKALASANDIAACQNAARELRLAGVAVPSPLLALAALDLQYQAKTK